MSKEAFQTQNDKLYGMKIVIDSGSSEELKPGQIISARQLREENSRIKRKDGKLVEARDSISAVAAPVLQGITRAAVNSWISAARSNKTTKVLNEAAINANVELIDENGDCKIKLVREYQQVLVWLMLMIL